MTQLEAVQSALDYVNGVLSGRCEWTGTTLTFTLDCGHEIPAVIPDELKVPYLQNLRSTLHLLRTYHRREAVRLNDDPVSVTITDEQKEKLRRALEEGTVVPMKTVQADTKHVPDTLRDLVQGGTDADS